MKNWPAKHRNLLAVFIFLLIACLAYGYVRLRPVWNQYTETRDEKASLESRLTKSEWPKDPERLQAMLKDYDKKLKKDSGNGKGKGLEDETKEILHKATSLFNAKIEGEYGTIPDFIQKASQTEYKDQYDRLDTYLQGKNININSTVFGMDELTSGPQKYQMLLKLWTVQAVVDCALKANMRISQQNMGGGHRGNRTAQIKVCQMKSYMLNDNDTAPYLLEFPVQMEITGTLDNFSAFVDSLFTEGRFLPITQMELVALKPQSNPKRPPRPDENGEIRYNNIVARVVCSSFFMPNQLQQKVNVKSKSSATTQKPPGI